MPTCPYCAATDMDTVCHTAVEAFDFCENTEHLRKLLGPARKPNDPDALLAEVELNAEAERLGIKP